MFSSLWYLLPLLAKQGHTYREIAVHLSRPFSCYASKIVREGADSTQVAHEKMIVEKCTVAKEIRSILARVDVSEL
jgi:hypothetical protein